MKIILLSSTNNIKNGYGNITHELCEAYKEKGVDFVLLLPKSEPRYDYTSYPVEYVLPEYIFTFKTPKIIDYIFFNYSGKADIVHSLFEFPYALLGMKVAKKLGVPFYMGAQGTYGITPLLMWPEKYFVKRMYNFAQKIFVPSEFTRTHLIGFSHTKTPVKIIHNGINYARFSVPVETASIKDKYNDQKLLLTVGGLKPRKGQDVVIRALKKVTEKYPQTKYLLIGKGEYESFLRKLAEEVGVSAQVEFLGEKVGEELVKYFWAADIYVHVPVLVGWNFEGFGIVYVEASACGKPIVAADSGGIKNAVIQDKTGLIVSENDVDETASAIIRLLENPTLREQLGKQGREYASGHDWSIIASQFLREYE